MKPTLVFVYNADSGIFNTLSDMAHKIFSPETYACNLCAITHGTFAIRAEWQEFLVTLDAELEFLHRDELAVRYGLTGIELPAVLLKSGGKPEPWLTAREINDCRSMDDLKVLITGRLES